MKVFFCNTICSLHLLHFFLFKCKIHNVNKLSIISFLIFSKIYHPPRQAQFLSSNLYILFLNTKRKNWVCKVLKRSDSLNMQNSLFQQHLVMLHSKENFEYITLYYLTCITLHFTCIILQA